MIKKNHKTGNEYLLASGKYWVRNFNKKNNPIDVNALESQEDQLMFIENEMNNMSLRIMQIENESITAKKCIIVSDGFGIEEEIRHLANIPNNVIVIGVNRILNKWSINRMMNYYLVNNPYKECMSYLSKNDFYPPCIASTRTYHNFLKRYSKKSTVYVYSPTSSRRFAGVIFKSKRIDDYRNPICAAVVLASFFGATQLGLFCIEELLSFNKSGSIKLKSKYTYPQHLTSKALIDANLYWFKKREDEDDNIEVFHNSPEMDYINGDYIETEAFIEKFK